MPAFDRVDMVSDSHDLTQGRISFAHVLAFVEYNLCLLDCAGNYQDFVAVLLKTEPQGEA